MLVYYTKLIGLPVLNIDLGGPVARLGSPIINPDSLQIVGFFVENSPAGRTNNILDISSIREYSHLGVVIDDNDEFIAADDVIKIRDVLALKFNPLGLKVESKKRTHLGRIVDLTINTDDAFVHQIIVHRPLLKSLNDPELIIPRSEVVEVTDTKIIVKDEEKTIRERASNEDFIPSFVNPFRTQKPDYAPARTKTPDGTNN